MELDLKVFPPRGWCGAPDAVIFIVFMRASASAWPRTSPSIERREALVGLSHERGDATFRLSSGQSSFGSSGSVLSAERRYTDDPTYHWPLSSHRHAV
jgi:hypothetical protein